MKKLTEDTFEITRAEADQIHEFIRYELDRSWDRYTDHYICEGTSWEEGMKRMNPGMYEMADKIYQLMTE